MAFNVKEYSQNRRKQNKTSTSFNIDLYSKYRNIDQVGENLTNRINKWVNNNNNFISNFNDRYKTYRTDSDNWVNTVSTQKSNFDKEAESIKKMLNAYKDFFDKDWVDSVYKALDEGTKVQDDIVKTSAGDKEFWSSFKDEKDFNLWQEKEAFIKTYIEDPQKAWDERGHAFAPWIDEAVQRREAHLAKNAEDFNDKSKFNSTLKYFTDLFGTKRPTIESSNEVYEYINNKDGAMKAMGSNDAQAFRVSEFRDKGYDEINEEEKALYNYFFNTQGADKAKKYLDSITDTLIKRKALKEFETLQGNTLAEIFYGVAAGADQFISGIKGIGNFITGEKGYTSSTQHVAGMVREDLADDGFQIFGASIGQIGYDLLSNTTNMLPSILVNKVTGGLGGIITMGVSATGNAYEEMRELGYDANQARAYAVLVGVSEAGLQHAMGGISNLAGNKSLSKMAINAINNVDNGIARVALKLGANMFSEGLEEATQEVLDPIFKYIATSGEESEVIDWGNVAYSGLLGALSAGVLESFDTIRTDRKTTKLGKEIKNAGAQYKLANYVYSNDTIFSADTVAAKIASKITPSTNAYQIGRLYQEVGATLSEQNLTDIRLGLEARHVPTKYAEKLANEYKAFLDGEMKLTDKAVAVLEQCDPLTSAIREKLIENNLTSYQMMQSQLVGRESDVYKRTREYTDLFNLANEVSGVTESASFNFMQAPYSSESIASKVNAAQNAVKNESYRMPQEYSAEIKTSEIAPKENEFQWNPNGKTIYKNKDVSIKGISSIKDGAVTVQLEDGRKVNAKYVSFSTEDEALMYDMVAKIGVNPETATFMMDTFNKGKGTVSAETYYADAPLAYQYGTMEYTKGLDKLNLTHDQKVDLFGRGRTDAMAKIQSNKPKLEVGEKPLTFKGKKVVRDGVVYEGVNPNSEMSDVQKAGIRWAELLSKVSSLEMHAYESYKDSDGNILVDIDGETVPAPNGIFRDGNKIYIDINAGKTQQGTMLYTIGHETGHYIRKWNAAEFKNLGDFLFENYKGDDVEELIAKKIDQRIKSYERDGMKIPDQTTLYDEAYEEIVCDSFSELLADENAATKLATLATLKKTNKMLWEKIGETLKNIINKIKKVIGAYKDVAPDSNALANGIDKESFNKLQDLYLKAFVKADENYQAATKNTVKTVSEGSNAKFSVRDWDSEHGKLITSAMDMETCKQMIERIYRIVNPNQYEETPIYSNAEKWLANVGADEVAMYADNEYIIQEKYLNKIPALIDGDIYTEEIIEAYQAGVLNGSNNKEKAVRLDISKDVDYKDGRFYSPQKIEGVKALYEIANQKLTNANRKEVTEARAKILLFAHNRGAVEELGITQSELNKKLRSWANYSAKALDISTRINKDVALSNMWTGIENSSYLYNATVSEEDFSSLVGDINGNSSEYERRFIASTMLALDTHIDYTGIKFIFGENNFSRGSVLGEYSDAERTIRIKRGSGLNTVAHEIGHAIDHQWERDVWEWSGRGGNRDNVGLSDGRINLSLVTDPEVSQWVKNFHVFVDNISDSSSIYNEYTQSKNEVFARFTAKFVEWTMQIATGRNQSFGYSHYSDKFTGSHFIEFTKILQEKAKLDAKYQNEKKEDALYSDRDSAGNQLTEEQVEFFKDSKVRDKEGNLLVVYHGTFEKFSVFDISKTSDINKLGRGHYFTSSIEDATKHYTRAGEDQYSRNDTDTKIDNMAYDLFYERGYDYEDSLTSDPEITEILDECYRQAEEYYSEKNASLISTYLNIKNPLFVKKGEDVGSIYDRVFVDSNNKIVDIETSDILGSEYDGIIDTTVPDTFQGVPKGTIHVVAFDSNQIKLTTNKTPTANPDIRYSDRENFVEDKYFKSTVSKWDDLKKGSYVKVGVIGKKHPLCSVGMPEGVLRYDVDKLKKNMRDHGDYLNIALLKAIPDIIADPIAISEYTEENTVSVFGNFFVGKSPMMVGVTISKDRAGNDISKVRTYNARRDVGSLINDETVLYLNEDKKKTRKWFQACGIQVPLGETKFGFIRSISQNPNSVNSFSKNSEKNSDRDPDSVSNRSLLANALESVAQNDIERNKLEQYKQKIELINSEEQKLHELREQIKELSFSNSTRDAGKIKSLQDEANKVANRINTYDRQLLTLEASKPLKAVLEREKQLAYKRAEQKGKDALSVYRKKSMQKTQDLKQYYQESRTKAIEGRHKTEMRNKIKKVVSDLNRLLTKGTKERNVKIELQESVKKALELSDILLSDEYTNEVIARHGVESVTNAEAELLKEYNAILDELDPYKTKLEALNQQRKELKRSNANAEEIDAVTAKIDAIHNDADYKKLRAKLSNLNSKINDVFVRERNRYNKANATSVMDGLISAYESLKDSKEDYIKNAYQSELLDKLTSLRKSLGNVQIKDMTFKDLKDIYDAYVMVKHIITNANQIFRNGQKESLNNRIEAVQSELNKMNKERKDRPDFIENVAKHGRSFSWNNLRPVDAFERLGSKSFKDLFWDSIKAQSVYAKDIEEAKNVISKARDKYLYKKWDLKQAKTFKTENGLEFKLTLGDMMSIYAYSFRDQAYDHMTIGGFTFDTGKTYKEKKNGITYTHTQLGKTYVVGEETIKQIINSLNASQKAYVKEVQSFLTDMGTKGNEVSRILYGIDIFNESHYFPLQSAKDYRSSVEQALNATQTMVSLKNTGMTKQTVPHANNPIVLKAFDDVVLEHIDKMSKYHAYVIPIENLQKVFNNVGQDANQEFKSTKALISSTFGEEAKAYFDQYITDLNGGGTISGAKNPLSSFFGKAKGMAVAANLSVVIQQPFAIVRAMTEVDAKYFAPFLNSKASKTDGKAYEEMKKYAPVAIIKEMGGFDVGSNRGAVDYIGFENSPFSKEKAAKKFQDATMFGATMMDKLGWLTIWKAVKREIAATRSDLVVGSNKFLTACGDRFTEVVTKTQVYDSVNTRSGYMRSKHDSVKYLTSFMGEPTVSVGMYFTATNNFIRSLQSKDKTKIKADAKNLAKTYATLPIAGALTAIAKALVQAMRDEEEDESFYEKWLEKYFSNLKSDLNPLNSLPVFKDIMSIVEGWDVERPDMTLIADLITSIKKVFDEDTSWEETLNAVGSFANIIGVPLKNVVRDIKGFIQTTNLFINGEKTTLMGIETAIKEGWEGKEIPNAQQLYEAIIAGDQAQIDRVMGRFKDQEAAEKSLRSETKKKYLLGEIDSDNAMSFLTEYCGMTEDDAYWKVQEWTYELENGNSDEYSKYDEFFTAVETGKNIKAVVKEYIDNGVSKQTLAAQITNHYKPLYIEMSKAERAKLKGYLLNAYVLLGYKRSEKAKDIDSWIKD